MEPSDGNTEFSPRHFYSLDALRGLAALGVVFWHWQHFFYNGTEIMPGFVSSQQPLYFLFKPLYSDGQRAVELFFCLSGFIFYWLYSEKISDRKISAKEFFVLRFSRLYPLHCLTLLVVALGQQLMLGIFGQNFIYSDNDFFHFILQLLFASSWGFERGFSFNGPIWSVSVEVLLYAVFFIACFLNLRRWWHLSVFVVAGYLLMRYNYVLLGRGTFSYFIGCLSYLIFSRVSNRTPTRFVLCCLGALTAVMWVVVPVNRDHETLSRIYQGYFGNVGLKFHGMNAASVVLKKLESLSIEMFLFPLTIVTLALWDAKLGVLTRRLAFLGKISYSSYLWHFPLQMVFAGGALLFAIPKVFFIALGLWLYSF